MFCDVNNTKYSDIDFVMPFMFSNDIWILILNELLKNEKNPVKHIYGSVYCVWQSGRAARVFENDLSLIEKYLQTINKLGLIPNFTFSSLNISSEKLNDKFCNELLDLAYKYNSYFIVSSDLLYKHIKQRYNDAKMVCSVILPSSLFYEPDFNETEFYKRKLDEYEIIVIRPEYTIENIEKLNKLFPDISRVEVLINQNCFYNCPNHKKHYLSQEAKDFEIYSKKQGNSFEIKVEDMTKICPHGNIPSSEFRSVRMNKFLMEQLMKQGVKKFKLQGRDGNFHSIFNDLYEFFFNNNISQDELKTKIDVICADILQNNNSRQFLYLAN